MKTDRKDGAGLRLLWSNEDFSHVKKQYGLKTGTESAQSFGLGLGFWGGGKGWEAEFVWLKGLCEGVGFG